MNNMCTKSIPLSHLEIAYKSFFTSLSPSRIHLPMITDFSVHLNAAFIRKRSRSKHFQKNVFAAI